MASRSSRVGLTAVAIGMVLAGIAAADEAAERALWTVWTAHQKALTNLNAKAALAACEQFEKDPAGASFRAVGRGIAAWHALRLGLTNQAVATLTAMSADGAADPIGKAGQTMAYRWLTRLDRERVRGLLQVYYRSQIRYPESLDAIQNLMQVNRVPATDRWGKPWAYRLTSFKHIRGLDAQRYDIESPSLARTSDLAKALAAPYADALALRPMETTEGGSGKPAVMFETGGAQAEKVLLTEGTDYRGVALVRVGVHLLILSNGDHWLVLPNPGKASP